MKPCKFKFFEKNTIFISPGIPLIEGRMNDHDIEHSMLMHLEYVQMTLMRAMGIPSDRIDEFRERG